MRCPQCGEANSQVKDSRPSEDDRAVRRRRECPSCGARFTTFERVQKRDLVVVKRSGRRVPLDRDKLYRSISIAARKRNIDEEQIERMVSDIIREMERSGEDEISTRHIGELVMEALRRIDDVAFVRFASVYHDFQRAADFSRFLARMAEGEGREKEHE